PAKLESGLAERVVPLLRARMPFREIRSMGRDLVSNDTIFDVLLIGQAEMLCGRDVTKHGCPVPADHRSADGAGDVIVARSDVGGQWPQRVEGGLVGQLELKIHV